MIRNLLLLVIGIVMGATPTILWQHFYATSSNECFALRKIYESGISQLAQDVAKIDYKQNTIIDFTSPFDKGSKFPEEDNPRIILIGDTWQHGVNVSAAFRNAYNDKLQTMKAEQGAAANP